MIMMDLNVYAIAIGAKQYKEKEKKNASDLTSKVTRIVSDDEEPKLKPQS